MPFELIRDFLVKHGRPAGELRPDMHPGDLADIIAGLSLEQKQELFLLLPEADAAALVQEMEEDEQVELIRVLTHARASAILSEMDADDATDLLAELPPKKAGELLAMVEEETKEDIEELLAHAADSAGGIMTTDYIALSDALQVSEAFPLLRQLAPGAEVVYYVYAVDSENRLTGVVNLRELIAARDDTHLRDIMRKHPISVAVDVNQEEVARVVSKYDLVAVPVTDGSGHLLGVITVDDIIDVIEEEATEDILRLAGAGRVEDVKVLEMPVGRLAWKRLPWLLISLFGGMVAGSVISAYEAHLQSVIVLAVFIPMIMNMGGGVGTQSSTIAVRALATGEMDLRMLGKYVLHEVKIGAALGLLNGVVIAIVASIWKDMPVLGLVIGLAMFATLTVAALIGIMVPVCSVYLRIDPAMTAGPFVTTLKDIAALLVYFGIASFFMAHLV
ncbi:MAG TPA: magnesium transporter [Clostridiales bacterium UBA8153]|nr:magnesium transporter [Clostridiales bacterium UBA8153]